MGKNKEAWRKAWGVLAMAALLMFFSPVHGNRVRAEDLEIGSMTTYMDDTAGAALPAAGERKISTMSVDQSWSFKSQLTEMEMEIYETLEGVQDWRAVTKANPVWVEFPKGLTVHMDDQYAATSDGYKQCPEFKQYYASWVRAANAFQKDYNEYYWQFSITFSWAKTSGNPFTVKKVGICFNDYYPEIADELDETAQALAKASASVTGSTRYEKAKSIHDYVAQLITYPSGNLYLPRYHTITSGLLAKYGHYGVCECYAKLFRILCQREGIPCILVTGGSKSSSSGEVVADHMWNYVQMDDGKWYLVDTTWDDQGTRIAPNYFLAGKTTKGTSGLATEKDHIPVGCYSSSTTYEPFVMPMLAESSYVSNNPDKVSGTPPVTGISLSMDAMELECHGRQDIAVEVEPADASLSDLEWEVSNPGIVSILRAGATATVLARDAGDAGSSTTEITVRAKDNPDISASCKVTVSHAYGWETKKEATVHEEGEEALVCGKCGAEAETRAVPKQEVEGIALGDKSIDMPCNGTAKLTASIQPDGLRGCELAWKSSAPGTVSITKDGDASCSLKAVKAGTASITVWETSRPDITASCTVTVSHAGGTRQEVSLQPTCTEKGILSTICQSCGETLAEKDIEATGHKPGEWEQEKAATSAAPGSKVKKCTVCHEVLERAEIPKLEAQNETQKQPSGPSGGTEPGQAGQAAGSSQGTPQTGTAAPAQGQEKDPSQKAPAQPGKATAKKAGVRWAASTFPMQKGTSFQAAKLLTFAKGDSAAKWSSSNKKVVAVSRKGKLTAKKKGTATITVTSRNGAKASCKVTVQAGKVKTKKLSLKKKAVTLKKGKTLKLAVARFPATANDKLAFKSSNPKVASVSVNGKVQAKKKGTATITVKAQSGRTIKIRITVK